MPSLWTPTDWPQRLAELQAPTGELKEAPLRRDVRSLGMLLGEVLREQAGESLYDAVEALRRTAIARREAEAPQSGAANEASASAHLQRALDRVRTLDLSAAYQLTRAFGFYFELINLAETNHRKRRRLSHQLSESASSAATVQRGDLRGTLRRLREAGVCAEEAYALLRRVCVSPVFTAHPTEVARRSVMFKRRRISDLLEQLDRIPVPEAQLEALEHDLIAEITALWQTDDVRSARPTVRDEIRMALDYYESSLFDTLPVLYGEVASALAAEYPAKHITGSVTNICDLPLLIRFGSWIGGDRDGNPFVTPQATRDALAMAHSLLAYAEADIVVERGQQIEGDVGGLKVFRIGVSDVHDDRPQRALPRRRDQRLALSHRCGVQASQHPCCNGFRVALDARYLSSKENLRETAQLQCGCEQRRSIDVGVAMDLAIAQKLRILESRDQPQHPCLIAVFQVILEADQVVGRAGAIFPA